MISYILRRLLLMIPVAFLVTIGVFALARLSPADPVLVFAGEERDPVALAEIRTQLGLDQPLPVQYVAWLSRAVQGDLG
ncbi:MAG: ABC transporter permease, partial [Candidatus Limnocylindria bacterium]